MIHSLSQVISRPPFLYTVALCFFGLVLALIISEQDSSARESTLPHPSLDTPSKPTLPSNSLTPRPQIAQNSRQETVLPPTHEVKDLYDFHLPHQAFENASFEDILSERLDSYRQICRETQEAPLPLTWDIIGKPLPIPKIQLHGTLLNDLQLSAAAAAMTFSLEENHLIFERITDPSSSVTTRSWKTQPHFDQKLKVLSGKLNITDAHTEPAPTRIYRETTVEEHVHDSRQVSRSDFPGIEWFTQEGESVQWLGGTSTLLVKANSTSLSRIDALMRAFNNAPLIQLKIEMALQIDGETENMPTVMAKPGQSATLEVGHELKANDVLLFAGTRVKILPELYGLGERLASGCS